MARKSKAKFKMKGHSIPGIKGFKNTTLEDGRAASSAFQMKSPLEKDEVLGDNTDLDLTDPTKGEKFSEGIDKSYEQQEEESATAYALRQIRLLRDENKAKKEQKENNPSEVLGEKTTKYDTTDLEKGQQGPHPEGDQDGDGVLDSEQGPKHDRDGDGVPDYIQNPNTEINESFFTSEETREQKLDDLNKIINNSEQNSPEAKEAVRLRDQLTGYHDERIQNLIDKAQSGTDTSEGSTAFMDIKKIYPEKSNEEIRAMIERGKI